MLLVNQVDLAYMVLSVQKDHQTQFDPVLLAVRLFQVVRVVQMHLLDLMVLDSLFDQAFLVCLAVQIFQEIHIPVVMVVPQVLLHQKEFHNLVGKALLVVPADQKRVHPVELAFHLMLLDQKVFHTLLVVLAVRVDQVWRLFQLVQMVYHILVIQVDQGERLFLLVQMVLYILVVQAEHLFLLVQKVHHILVVQV